MDRVNLILISLQSCHVNYKVGKFLVVVTVVVMMVVMMVVTVVVVVVVVDV